MNFPHGLKRAATLCVLKNHQSFMLLKRNKEPNQGLFTPVGGKLDPYENPLQAAIRETREETGIDIDNIKFCGMLTETSAVKYNWINYVYLAEIEKITPPVCNEGELKWIHFDDVLKKPTPKTDWFIYKYILNNRPFAFNADFNEKIELVKMVEEIEGVVVFEKS